MYGLNTFGVSKRMPKGGGRTGGSWRHSRRATGTLNYLIWNVCKCMKHRLLHLWHWFNVYVYVSHLSGLCCGILPVKMYGAYGLQAHGPCFLFFLFCPLPLAFNQRSCLTGPRSQKNNILFWNILIVILFHMYSNYVTTSTTSLRVLWV